MKLSVIIKIAYKNLWIHRLRATLTILGVTIGIGAIVFLVSLGYGLEQLVTKQVANFTAFTVIDVPSANLKTINLDQAAITRMQDFAHIETIAPVVNIAGRVRKQDASSAAETVIIGANDDYWKLSEIYADRGSLPKGQSEVVVNNSVITLIGETPEKVIGQKIKLDLIIPADLQTKGASEVKIVEGTEATISGVLKDDKSPVILVPMSYLSSNGAERYSSLKVKVDRKENVEGLRKQLENMGFSSEYVGDTVNEIAQVFTLFRAILAAFGLIALTVAALGAFNTLTISLLERIREVGLFKALGMRNKDVYRLFMTESLLIGLAGGALGLAIGELLGLTANQVLSYFARRAGTDAVIIFITPWLFAVIISVFSVVVGFLTGWYPAKRAVKLNPLDALRYE